MQVLLLTKTSTPDRQTVPALLILKNHEDVAELLPAYIKNKTTICQALDQGYS